MKKNLIWIVAVAVTLPFVIKAFRDPATQARYDLEVAAMEACRATVRAKSDHPDKVSFKIGWRQQADMANRTVIMDGHATLTAITGDSVTHFYRCRYNGDGNVAEMLELYPDEKRLMDKTPR